MSRRKALSMEEKRERLKDFFTETKSVFLLKELEKIVPKEKGIVAQSVEDVLKSLLGDNIVSTDKIGTSNYFWLFPSQEYAMIHNNIDSLESQLQNIKRKRENEENKTKELLKGREESEERNKKIQCLSELRENIKKYHDDLTKYAENDPDLIEALKKDANDFKDHANRWTDNIFTLRSYADNKFNIIPSDFDRNFQIPEDFDYID